MKPASHSVEHDLKTVTVTAPLTDSGVEVEMVTYYRYSDDSDSELKMIVGPEGVRNYGTGYATASPGPTKARKTIVNTSSLPLPAMIQSAGRPSTSATVSRNRPANGSG